MNQEMATSAVHLFSNVLGTTDEVLRPKYTFSMFSESWVILTIALRAEDNLGKWNTEMRWNTRLKSMQHRKTNAHAKI